MKLAGPKFIKTAAISALAVAILLFIAGALGQWYSRLSLDDRYYMFSFESGFFWLAACALGISIFLFLAANLVSHLRSGSFNRTNDE